MIPARRRARRAGDSGCFCSNRGQRQGCGRTFAVFLADVLPRHTVTAVLVWRWLVQWLAGLSLKAAVEKLRLPFALETFYRLRRRLRHRLDGVRTRLSREQPPPASAQNDPCCKPWNIFKPPFRSVPVPWRIFSGSFNCRCWVEIATGPVLLAELPPPGFFRRAGLAGDNTTIPSTLPRPSRSVAA